MRRGAFVVLVASVAVALRMAAQRSAPPTIVLDKGATEFADPFSQLTQLVELRDRRVLAVDMKEKELRVADFASGNATPVSRSGAGPLEFQVPGILLLGAADTAVYWDMMQRRLLLVSPTGAPVRTVPLGGTDPTTMLSQMQPFWVDAAGLVYGQTMGFGMPVAGGAPAPSFADSVEIQVRDLRTGRTESLARVRSPMSQSKPKMEMGPQGARMTVVAPSFRPTDSWTVLPNGRVAILRDGVYRVHFVARGRDEAMGPTVAHVPVAVTAAERRAVVDSTRTAMDRSMKSANAATAQAAPGKAFKIEIEVLEPESWPAAKPAYSGIQASPDGRLWVSMHMPAGTKFSRYDVLDGSGALIAHVQLAPGESLVGLGRGTVYTVRTDSDDLQYLRRYTLPAPIG